MTSEPEKYGPDGNPSDAWVKWRMAALYPTSGEQPTSQYRVTSAGSHLFGASGFDSKQEAIEWGETYISPDPFIIERRQVGPWEKVEQ